MNGAPRPTPAEFRAMLAMMTDDEILQLLALFRLGLLCMSAAVAEQLNSR